MSYGYSFIDNPVLIMLSRMQLLLPGFNRAIGIYYKTAGHSPFSYLLSQPDRQEQPEPMEISSTAKDALKPYLNYKSGYYWFSPEELPFEAEKPRIRQMEIMSELNRNVLLIVTNPGNQEDICLVILYLTNSLGPFRISSHKPLSADIKSIIGMMTYNSISSQLMSVASDKRVFEEINDNTRSLAGSYKKAQQQNSTLKEKYSKTLADYCRLYVNELTEAEDFRYSLSAEAVEKICNWEGELEQLKAILEKAVGFARSMNFGSDTDNVTIEDFHVNLNVKKEETKKPDVISLPSKYLKTIELLDRLEAAALIVKSQHADLTGANVGRACARPVSAPAITEALQKHSVKIIELLKQFPNRWPTISKDFRPLQNILSAHTMLPDEKTMSA